MSYAFRRKPKECFTDNPRLAAVFRKHVEVSPLQAIVYDFLLAHGPMDADDLQMRVGVASKARFDAVMLVLKECRLIDYRGAARDGSWRANK